MTKEVTIYRDKGYQVKLHKPEYDSSPNLAMVVEVEEMGVVSEQALLLTPEEIVAMGYKLVAAGEMYKNGKVLDIQA